MESTGAQKSKAYLKQEADMSLKEIKKNTLGYAEKSMDEVETTTYTDSCKLQLIF